MKSISTNCKSNYSNVLYDVANDNDIVIRQDIIDFLKMNSGGYPVNDVVKFNGEEYEIRVFLSLDDSDANYYIKKPLEYFLKKTKGKIVPIGIDSGDNYYCVNNETGNIYFWSAGEDLYYKISESVMEFTEMFR